MQTIFWSVGASRNALAQRLAYSKSKANAMVAALLDVGLLDEVGLQESSGGRRAETLRLSETLGVVIGADRGATSILVAVKLRYAARHDGAGMAPGHGSHLRGPGRMAVPLRHQGCVRQGTQG